MTTISTMFSGGEGVGVGAKAAGLTHLWGIELKDEIAKVARNNGFNVMTASVLDVDPHTLERPDILHASPECQRASIASQSRGETDLDIALGERVIHFIDVLKPRIVTIENVGPYQTFSIFKKMLAFLANHGYFVHHDILNAADFSVPQSRRRLIVRAVLGNLVPMLPEPEPWVGWYQAIEDLIPTLPPSRFAPWQMERLPNFLDTSTFFGDNESHFEGSRITQRRANEPASTIVSSKTASKYKAFLLSTGGEAGDLYRWPEEPAPTATTIYPQYYRAFIVDSQNGGSQRGLTIRDRDEPTFTVTASALNKATPRAWLSAGRVVAMTARAIARFQSFPDDYELPDGVELASKVIGNAMPSLMYQKLVRPLKEMIQ